MKKIMILLFVVSLTACGKDWKFNNEVVVDPDTKTVILESSPSVKMTYRGSLDQALTASHYLEEVIGTFNGLGTAGVDEINIDLSDDDIDFRGLFFRIGKVYFSDFQNQAIAWGIINLKWQELIRQSIEKEDYLSLLLKPYRYEMIPIEDFKELFKEYQLTIDDMSQLAQYINYFLLEGILFVSVQEMQDRSWRYFSLDDLNTFFFQGVILVEMTEFIRFLEKRYGMKKVLQLASLPYDKEEWAGYVGVELTEIERDFAKMLESGDYTGAFTNPDFLEELNRLLILYNSETTTTLFKGFETE